MSDPSAIRIKLEGRLEVLEAALRRYAELERLVGGNWRRRAIEERPQVLEVLSHEAAVEDALETAARVAARDHWKPSEPVLALIGKIRAYREELTGRLGGASWAAAAKRLHDTAASVRLPGKDEVVIMNGIAERAIPMWLIVAVPSVLGWWALGWMAALGVAVSAICLALAVIPLGTYLILADRLVWLPYTGVPVEVPLHALRAITVKKRSVTVEAAGVTLRLPAVDSGDAMTALLLLYRDGPLKGLARPPSGTTMVLPATLASAAPEAGHALLHSEGFYFLPRGGARAMLKRLIDRDDLDVSEVFVLEQLSRLPVAGLSELLETMADLPGSVNAPAERVTPDPVSAAKLRLRVGLALVDLTLSGVDAVALTTNLPWTKAR